MNLKDQEILILSTTPDDNGLALFDSDLLDAEYSELSENIRHTNKIRSNIVQYWISLNSIMFTFFGAIVATHKNIDTAFALLLIAISLFGILNSILAISIEKRNSEIFMILLDRLRLIEFNAGIYGQYWKTYEHYKDKQNIFFPLVSGWLHILFSFVIVIWCLIILWLLFFIK